jgi:hypothetical protein
MKTEKRYFLKAYGYTYPDPERLTLEEARKALSEELQADAKACRRRYGKAVVYRTSRNCGRVLLGRDLQSALWSAWSIQPLF